MKQAVILRLVDQGTGQAGTDATFFNRRLGDSALVRLLVLLVKTAPVLIWGVMVFLKNILQCSTATAHRNFVRDDGLMMGDNRSVKAQGESR